MSEYVMSGAKYDAMRERAEKAEADLAAARAEIERRKLISEDDRERQGRVFSEAERLREELAALRAHAEADRCQGSPSCMCPRCAAHADGYRAGTAQAEAATRLADAVLAWYAADPEIDDTLENWIRTAMKGYRAARARSGT